MSKRCKITGMALALATVAGCQQTVSEPMSASGIEARVADAGNAVAATRPARPAPRTIEQAMARFEIDPRLTLCHVWETPTGDLAGFVEFPQHRALLAKWLNKDVSRVKLLPEESASDGRFGIVTVPHAILRQNPVDAPGDRDNVSDLIFGEPVWILDRQKSGAMLVHASDGYLGWVDEAPVWRVPEEHFTGLSERWSRKQADADFSRAAARRDVEQLKRADSPMIRGEVARRRIDLILNEAKALLGTPYLWGGKTKAGIDCSGLVQMSFGKHGIVLPRDADQQANVGRLVATRWMTNGLLPGDMLFFLSERNGNVHHVAIYMGDGKFIESADTGVRVRSMNPGDPDFDESRTKTFAWARRVID